MQDRSTFGIVLINEGRLAKTGCEVSVIEISNEQPGGEFDIQVQGKRRFALGDISEKHEYLTVSAEWKTDKPVASDLTDSYSQSLERVIAQHMKLLDIAGRTVRPHLYEGADQAITFFIAHNSGMSLEQKQFMLNTDSLHERVEFLSEHLQNFISRIERIEELHHKVVSNGHFKDFPPELDIEK